MQMCTSHLVKIVQQGKVKTLRPFLAMPVLRKTTRLTNNLLYLKLKIVTKYTTFILKVNLRFPYVQYFLTLKMPLNSLHHSLIFKLKINVILILINRIMEINV